MINGFREETLLATSALFTEYSQRTKSRIALQKALAEKNPTPREVGLLLMLQDTLFELDQSRRMLERIHERSSTILTFA